MRRNAGPAWSGTVARHAPEWWPGMSWNPQLSDAVKQTNRRKSAVRSKIEHPFLTLKRLWGFAKARYRGLEKNANRAYAMLALINISKWGRPLTGEVSAA